MPKNSALSSEKDEKDGKEKYKYNLAQLWERYTHFKKAILEQTTILMYYRSIARCIERLPSNSLDKAVLIRDWLLENTTYKQAYRSLAAFSDCCEWAISSGLIFNNPFVKLKIKSPKKKSTQEDYRAFTLEQRDLIIEAYEQHYRYSHYAPLVKFLFLTGARLGEAFALTWADVQENCTRIHINKSCNLEIL